MQRPEDFKGGAPFQQPAEVFVQPPMMQVPAQGSQGLYPQGQYQQYPAHGQPMNPPQPIIVSQIQGYGYPVPPVVKTATLTAGVMFLLASVLNTIFIFIAMSIGWIPWFNYPFDILVVIVCCCTSPFIYGNVKTIQMNTPPNQSSTHGIVVTVGFVIHLIVLVAESINLVLSLCPYAFYLIDSLNLFILFIEFVMALVCMLASMM